MEKLIIGSHVSFNKQTQLVGSVNEAISYGATTFMFYTGAPQNTARYPIDDSLTNEALKLMQENDIDIKNVVIHAPYIINLANAANKDFGVSFLRQELSRAKKLGINKVVLHPGSHVGIGIEEGIKNIAACLNLVPETQEVNLCLETMAGKGSEIASKLEEIKKIMNLVKYPLYVCVDTCHLNDAGYDMSDFDKFLEDFDNIIGLEKIKCVHINDSINPLGSHKDRHANIGYGTIGFENLIKIIYHDKLKDIPKILETPYTSISGERLYPPYKFEIEMIKNKKFNESLIENIDTYYR